MTIEIFMPKAGAMMQEATINKWLKREGEKVTEGEILIEIEAEKTTMEIESPVSGILSEIFVDDGDEAEVGTVLGLIEG
ncbi:biotin/lipoyl-containing protein [Peribacillus frigoritolerans]|uniref:biotin/lipoyl-containing protein n=1 Tax=Peribacillus frigoritolerans TaxID=450367 RepID=UPI0038723045